MQPKKTIRGEDGRPWTAALAANERPIDGDAHPVDSPVSASHSARTCSLLEGCVRFSTQPRPCASWGTRFSNLHHRYSLCSTAPSMGR